MRTLLLSLLCFCACLGTVQADTLTFGWDANKEPDLAGYRLYQGTQSKQYGSVPVATLGKVTTHALVVPKTLADQSLFFALTAVDLTGNQSLVSNEVHKVVLALPPAPVLTVTAAPTVLTVSWPPLPPLTKIDLRVSVAGTGWGASASVICAPTAPCTVPGLTPGTPYEVRAVLYQGTQNVDAVHGPLSAVVQMTTPLEPPVIPPVVPPIPGLTIDSCTPTQIVIHALVQDCPRLLTSTKGSTKLKAIRTLICADAAGNPIIRP